MSKKIIILNGSPRKAGNTAALTAEFKKGAEEAGNTVTEFFLDGMNILKTFRMEKHWKSALRRCNGDEIWPEPGAVLTAAVCVLPNFIRCFLSLT